MRTDFEFHCRGAVRIEIPRVHFVLDREVRDMAQPSLSRTVYDFVVRAIPESGRLADVQRIIVPGSIPRILYDPRAGRAYRGVEYRRKLAGFESRFRNEVLHELAGAVAIRGADIDAESFGVAANGVRSNVDSSW